MAARQHAVHELFVMINEAGWGKTVGIIIFLLRESLAMVSLFTQAFEDDSAAGILHLLAPLEGVTRLRKLTVLSYIYPELTAAQLHLLPRLGRLPHLQDLVWRLSSECVPPEFGRLTSLTRLQLTLAWYPATASSLQQLSSLTGLQALVLWSPSIEAPPVGAPLEFLTPTFSSLNRLSLRSLGLVALPPAVMSLQQLTHLGLLGNRFSAPDSLEGLQQLSNLRRLSLHRCGLRRLPPQLTALSALRELRMASQPSQQVTAAELRGMLEHMPGLTRLSLDERTAQRITAVEWVRLARAWPSVELTFGHADDNWF